MEKKLHSRCCRYLDNTESDSDPLQRWGREAVKNKTEVMNYGLRTVWSIFNNHRIIPVCDSGKKEPVMISSRLLQQWISICNTRAYFRKRVRRFGPRFKTENCLCPETVQVHPKSSHFLQTCGLSWSHLSVSGQFHCFSSVFLHKSHYPT